MSLKERKATVPQEVAKAGQQVPASTEEST